MSAWPYSGWVPAKTTVPGAGALTCVPTGAPMSSPLWNSDLEDHGEERPPKPELTDPRTGQRDGSAASMRVARLRKRSSERRSSPSSLTTLVNRSSSSPMGASSDVSPARDGPVPPPMPVLRLAGPLSGLKGSQILARSSRHPLISAQMVCIFAREASMTLCCSATRAVSSLSNARCWRSER